MFESLLSLKSKTYFSFLVATLVALALTNPFHASAISLLRKEEVRTLSSELAGVGR